MVTQIILTSDNMPQNGSMGMVVMIRVMTLVKIERDQKGMDDISLIMVHTVEVILVLGRRLGRKVPIH